MITNKEWRMIGIRFFSCSTSNNSVIKFLFSCPDDEQDNERYSVYQERERERENKISIIITMTTRVSSDKDNSDIWHYVLQDVLHVFLFSFCFTSPRQCQEHPVVLFPRSARPRKCCMKLPTGRTRNAFEGIKSFVFLAPLSLIWFFFSITHFSDTLVFFGFWFQRLFLTVMDKTIILYSACIFMFLQCFLKRERQSKGVTTDIKGIIIDEKKHKNNTIS